MKAKITFPKNATTKLLKDASVGKSFVFQGHRASANSPFYRAGFKFQTNMAWVVLLGTNAPVPVTIITITKLPEMGYVLN